MPLKKKMKMKCVKLSRVCEFVRVTVDFATDLLFDVDLFEVVLNLDEGRVSGR